MDEARGDEIGAVLGVAVLQVGDVLEVVGIDRTGRGVLVGLDVVGVLLHLELNALLGKARRGEVGEDLGDVLEVVGIDRTGRGVLVGLDVVGVLLHLELNALLGKARRGEVGEDLSVRGGAGGNGYDGVVGRTGGTGAAACGEAAQGEQAQARACGDDQGATGKGGVEILHDENLSVESA